MRLSWHDLGTSRADKAHGQTLEVVGWPTASLGLTRSDYFVLTAEANCCAGCVPNNPLAVIEVFADTEFDLGAGSLRLSGTLQVETNDPQQWRYQLRGARQVPGLKRRALLAASPLFCLPVTAMAQTDGMAVDLHSHAGNLIRAVARVRVNSTISARPSSPSSMSWCAPSRYRSSRRPRICAWRGRASRRSS